MTGVERTFGAALAALVMSLPASAQVAADAAISSAASGPSGAAWSLRAPASAEGPVPLAVPVVPILGEAAAAAPAALSLAPAAAAGATIDVTEEFLSVNEAVRAGALGGVALPAPARQARFILIKGLFGNHIPDYFDGSRRRLEALGLDVVVLPIDTEGSAAAGIRVIEDAVRRSDKPVVLLGHSRGGLLAHDWYRRAPPQIKAKVLRLALIQAPLTGTPFADWAGSNYWQYLKALAGGWIFYRTLHLPGIAAEMSVGARRRALAALPPWEPGDLEKVYAVRSVVPALSRGFYESRRARVARLGGGGNDGLVPETSARVEGARNIILVGVDHRQLMVERPDQKTIRAGYRPHPRFNGADVAEALARLIFR